MGNKFQVLNDKEATILAISMGLLADYNKIPQIFITFRKIGEPSVIPLLHLLMIPQYEFRNFVYDVLGEIGTKECIQYFEVMLGQENKYLVELNRAILKLKNKYN